jgi:hypothetical protein
MGFKALREWRTSQSGRFVSHSLRNHPVAARHPSSPQQAGVPRVARGGQRLRELGPHALREERHLLVEVGTVGCEELEHQMLDARRSQLADLVH